MRTWLVNFFLVSVTLSLCLVAGEALFRAKEDISTQISFYTVDPVRGWALQPGMRGWQKEEGNAYVEISSQGLRDREYSLKKPPGVFRIAVLGDSCTEALQVARKDTFLAVAEKQLSECPIFEDTKVEIMNFGVKGYGTAQELLTLREHVWKFEPDMVILAFFTGNDVYNNHPSLNPMMAERSPYFVEDSESGTLSLRTAYDASGLGSDDGLTLRRIRVALGRRSAMLRSVFRRFDKIGERALKKKVANWEERLGEDYLNWLTAKPPFIPEMEQAWRVTEKLIRQIDLEVRRKGAKFMLLNLTTPAQVHPDPIFREKYMEQHGLASLHYADNRLKDFSRKQKIPMLSLAKPLQAYAETNEVLLHGFDNSVIGHGHWNEIGHRVAGERFAEELCR